MARLGGFEPPTAWFVARYSIQLSYSRLKLICEIGAAGRIRTSDRLVRSQVLYPAELQPHNLSQWLNATSTGSRLSAGKWRRGRDSNPRYDCSYGSLAGNWFQPLTHLSLRTGRILPSFL